MSPTTRLGWHHRRLQTFDYASSDHAFSITIRAKHGTSPFTNRLLAEQVIDSLHWIHTNRQVAIYAYCLMPDHFHVLLRLPEESPPLGDIIGAFKRFTTRQSWSHGTQGALWQPRFHDRVVRQEEDMGIIVAYILANPERQGMVEEGEVYAWSGEWDVW